MTEELKQEEELKLREDADGSVIVGDDPPKEDEEDASLKNEDEGDEESHADEDTDEERAAKTERNRQRRKESKERRREGVETLRRELASRDSVINEMAQRLATVERRSNGSEMAQLDAAEKEAVQYYNHFKSMHGQAVEQANGSMATEASEKMMLARQRMDQIANIKKAVTQKQNQPAPLDPRLVNNAQSWLERNDWYNPDDNTDEADMVRALDKRIANEGWDPTTPQYWEELDKRVKKYLPHRTNQGYNKSTEVGSKPPRTSVAGSGRESSTSSTTSYRLSAERKQAMIDAGLWDDPAQRAQTIRRYQQQDKGAAK